MSILLFGIVSSIICPVFTVITEDIINAAIYATYADMKSADVPYESHVMNDKITCMQLCAEDDLCEATQISIISNLYQCELFTKFSCETNVFQTVTQVGHTLYINEVSTFEAWITVSILALKIHKGRILETYFAGSGP